MPDSRFVQLLVALVGFVLIVSLVDLILTWLMVHTNIGTPNYSRMHPDSVVVIGKFYDHAEAERLHNKLEGKGVGCMLLQEPFSNYRGARFPRDPRIKLEVRAGDAKRAHEVLATPDN